MFCLFKTRPGGAMLRAESPSLTRYLEIIFRSKLRLLVLVILLPLALSSLQFYASRSYEATEIVWVDDPGTFGQAIAGSLGALGYNPYQTPAQNAQRVFANLLGTQSFNNALGDKLLADGVIHTKQERAAVIASLSKLTVNVAGASGPGSGAPGTPGGDHTMTIQYTCTNEQLCLQVISEVLDIYRSQYGALKAKAAVTARTIYESQLKSAEADLSAALAAVTQYQAALPKTNNRQTQATDPILTALQRNIESAQRAVEATKAQLQSIETLAQVQNGMATDMNVIDPPQITAGLYGIKGLRSDNLKTDAIIWVSCLVAGVIYVVLLALVDHTVRDPAAIQARLDKPVLTIPDYVRQAAKPGRARFLRRKAKANATA
jgi:hypothetical protein